MDPSPSARRILLLTPQLPYPPHQGASLRNYHIIRGLSQLYDLTLLSFGLELGSSGAEAGDSPPLAALCRQVHQVPAPPRSLASRLRQFLFSPRPDMAHRLASPAFAAALRRLLRQEAFAVIQVEGLELAAYLPLLHQASPGSLVLFDSHNAETSLQRRAFRTDLAQVRRWPAAAYSLAQLGRLGRFEAWACRQADVVTAVSQADRLALEALAPERPVTVIPNCIDVARYQEKLPGAVPRYDLLFSGKMDYRPNVDAMLWFAEAIWPAIIEARPGTTLAIVGQRPHPRLEPLGRLPGITLTGWVPDVRPYLQGATVVVLPFRMGSGTRLKLIEAMAAGKAIVSTPIGAEGFPVAANQHLMLATGANAFAGAVLTLLTQPGRRERLGQASRLFARQYDWQQVIPLFYPLLQRQSV